MLHSCYCLDPTLHATDSNKQRGREDGLIQTERREDGLQQTERWEVADAKALHGPTSYVYPGLLLTYIDANFHYLMSRSYFLLGISVWPHRRSTRGMSDYFRYPQRCIESSRVLFWGKVPGTLPQSVFRKSKPAIILWIDYGTCSWSNVLYLLS